MQSSDPENEPRWNYHDDNQTAPAAQPTQLPQNIEQVPQAQELPATQKDEEPVSWTASEFMNHHRGGEWYAALLGGLALVCGTIYLLTKDIISVVAIAAVVILYLIISRGQPRQRSYALNSEGISIDGNFFPYSGFKSFAISQEGAIGCVTLMPLKRLMPELSIYFPPDEAERIMDFLTINLPNDQRSEHAFDKLMKKLHF